MIYNRVQAIFVLLTVLSAVSFAKTTGQFSPNINGKLLTNAARMARGLPPRPPKFGRYLPGGATPTIQARQANPSIVSRTGIIVVTRADDGTQLGYISRLYNDDYFRQNAVTTDITEAQVVSFPIGQDPFEMTKQGVFDGPEYPFLGLIRDENNCCDEAGVTSNNLGPGTGNAVDFIGTAHTDAGAPPTVNVNGNPTGTRAPLESTVFHYNEVTGEITASWVNNDGTPATTFGVWNPDFNTLAFTGDVAEYQLNYYYGTAVVYTLQP